MIQYIKEWWNPYKPWWNWWTCLTKLTFSLPGQSTVKQWTLAKGSLTTVKIWWTGPRVQIRCFGMSLKISHPPPPHPQFQRDKPQVLLELEGWRFCGQSFQAWHVMLHGGQKHKAVLQADGQISYPPPLTIGKDGFQYRNPPRRHRQHIALSKGWKRPLPKGWSLTKGQDLAKKAKTLDKKGKTLDKRARPLTKGQDPWQKGHLGKPVTKGPMYRFLDKRDSSGS